MSGTARQTQRHRGRRLAIKLLSWCLLHSAFCLCAQAQGTAFTYQGQLTESGQTANGLYDFRAQVYLRAVAGAPGDALVSGTLTMSVVPVTNGLLVLSLDFGTASPAWPFHQVGARA